MWRNTAVVCPRLKLPVWQAEKFWIFQLEKSLANIELTTCQKYACAECCCLSLQKSESLSCPLITWLILCQSHIRLVLGFKDARFFLQATAGGLPPQETMPVGPKDAMEKCPCTVYNEAQSVVKGYIPQYSISVRHQGPLGTYAAWDNRLLQQLIYRWSRMTICLGQGSEWYWATAGGIRVGLPHGASQERCQRFSRYDSPPSRQQRCLWINPDSTKKVAKKQERSTYRLWGYWGFSPNGRRVIAAWSKPGEKLKSNSSLGTASTISELLQWFKYITMYM